MKISSKVIIEFAALHRQFVPHTIERKKWTSEMSVATAASTSKMIRHTTDEMSSEHSEADDHIDRMSFIIQSTQSNWHLKLLLLMPTPTSPLRFTLKSMIGELKTFFDDFFRIHVIWFYFCTNETKSCFLQSGTFQKQICSSWFGWWYVKFGNPYAQK